MTATTPPPRWATSFIVPKGSCPPCEKHWHHRCHGVDVLRDPIPHCPCPCGDPTDPTGMRMNPQAWADLGYRAPDQVWIAVMFERQRANGIFICPPDRQGRR